VWFSLSEAFVRLQKLNASVVIILLLLFGGSDHRATKAPFMSPWCEKPTRGSSVRGSLGGSRFAAVYAVQRRSL
jgi:hypothetical protein